MAFDTGWICSIRKSWFVGSGQGQNTGSKAEEGKVRKEANLHAI
jgi:hypothetical protein